MVTLGNEALSVIRMLAEAGHVLPDRLSPGDTYGRVHSARVDGLDLEVFPLVHPGQRAALWRETHARWIAGQEAGRGT